MSFSMVLASIVLASTSFPAVEADENGVSLLQTSLRYHQDPDPLSAALTITLPPERFESGGMECGLDHSEDLYKYIPDVLAEHPGVDGYCYFEHHAPWMAYLGGKVTDYVVFGSGAVENMHNTPAMCPGHKELGTGPLKQLHYVGVDLYSYVDCLHQEGDDMYCHALGWLKNQRLDASLLANATAWEELAVQECQRMNETYQYTREEVTLGRHLDDQGRIFVEGDPASNARNFNLHAYHKCVLGHAADEMAYCMTVSCLLPPGNVIGHGPLCE